MPVRTRLAATALAILAALQPIAATAEPGYYFRLNGSGDGTTSGFAVRGPALVTGHVGSRLSATYATTGGDGRIAWGSTNFPTGFVVVGGALSGVPSTTGTTRGRVEAVDGSGDKAGLDVTIRSLGILKLVGVGDVFANAGADVATPVPTLQGDPVLPVTYEIVAGSVPAGLALDATTGVVSGRPLADGTNTLVLKATDATGADAVSASFTITVGSTLLLRLADRDQGRVGLPWTLEAPTVTGTYANPLTFALAHGPLPPGISLAPSGALGGTPTAAGLFPGVAVRATDARGRTGSTTGFGIEVLPPLSIGQAADQTYRLGVTMPPSGDEAAVRVPQPPAASGSPRPPVGWRLAGGAAPVGMTVDPASGRLVGTPTAAGDGSLSLGIVDGAGAKAASPAFATHVLPPLSMSPMADVSGATNAPLSAPGPTVTGSPVGQVTYSAFPPLPPGIVVDASTGALSGSTRFSTHASSTIVATDALGFPVRSNAFRVDVTGPFSIGPYAAATGRQGVVATYPAPAVSGTPSGSLTFAASAPAVVDPTTGALSYAPPSPGRNAVTVTATDAAGNAAQASLVVTAAAGVALSYDLGSATGLAPVARVGTGHVGWPMTLPATAGGTPQGVVGYAVTAGATPPGVSLDPATGRFAGTATTAGRWDMTVTATDAGLSRATATASVAMVPPATATAAPGTEGRVGTPVAGRAPATSNLVGAASWDVAAGSAFPPPGLYLDGSGAVAGTPQASGLASVRVTATDATGASATTADATTVDVLPPLAFEAVRDEPGRVGRATSVAAPALDNGPAPPVAYAPFGTLPRGLAMDPVTGLISGTPLVAGAATVAFRATDGTGATATSDAFTITVAPGIDAGGASDATLRVGAPARLAAPPIPAGTPLPATWALAKVPAWATVDPVTGIATGTPDAVATYPDEAWVLTAASGDTGAAPFALKVLGAVGIADPGKVVARIGVPTTIALQAQNAPDAPVTWSATGLPDGFSIDAASGVVSGTATANGTATVTASLHDGSGYAASRTFAIAVTPGLSVTMAKTALTGHVGTPLALAAPSVGGPPRSPVAFAASPPPPAGVALDAARGSLSGTPTAAGDVTLTLTVTDADGLTATGDPLTIHVTSPLTAAAASGYGRVGTATLKVAPATSVDAVAPSTWVLASGALPPGATLGSDGTPKGAPTATGTYAYAATVTDAVGGSATSPVAAINVLPAIVATAPTDLYARVGTPYASTGVTLDATAVKPASFVAKGGKPPAGLGVDGATGAVTGTATGPSGSATLAVSGADGDGFPFQTGQVTVHVVDGGPITVASYGPTLRAHLGAPASFAAPTFGNYVGPLAFAATGSPPPGVSVDAVTGAVSGTPTAVGDYPMGVVATDQTQARATASFTLAVSPPLAVGAVTGATGRVGLQQEQVQAPDVSGDPVTPVAWTVASGALPAGLALDRAGGFISGKPTTAGSYDLALTVTDAAGGSATTATFSLVVQAPLSMGSGGTWAIREGIATTVPAPAVGNGPTAPVFWTAAGIPTGFAFAPATGALTGTSGPSLSGTTRALTATATDATGATADDSTSPATLRFYPPLGFAQLGTVVVHQGSPAVVPAPTVTNTPVAPLVVTTAGTPPAGLAPGADGSLSGTPTAQGSSNLTFQASDATGGSATSGTETVTVLPPLAVAAGPGSGVVGVSGTVVPAPGVTGSPVAPTAFALASGTAPAGTSLSPTTGAIVGTPTTAGTSTLAITVTDGAQGTATSAPFTVTVSPAPSLSATNAQVTGGKTFSLALPAIMNPQNLSSPTPTWSATNLPAGVTVSSDGTLSGTYSGTAPIVIGIAVSVRDGNGLVANATLRLTVGLQPTLSDGTATIAIGRAATVFSSTALKASSLANPTYATSGLPATLTMDATGRITGTPVTAGSYALPVTASNSTGETATATLTLVVAMPPSISDASTTIAAGMASSLDAAGLTGASTTSTITAAGLPAGTTLSPAGRLDWTPSTTGPYNIRLTATDPNGLATSATLSITVSTPPRLTPAGDAAYVGSPYAGVAPTLLAAAGLSSPTWGATGLPSWLAISPTTGTLTGTPPAGSAGLTTVVVTVTNGNGLSATATLSLSVGAANLSAGLVAYWGFGEGSGTTATDSIGGRVLSTVSSWTPSGLVGSAYAPSATGTTASWGILTGNTARTTSAWIMTTSRNSMTVVSAGSSSIFETYVSNGNVMAYRNSYTFGTPTKVNDGAWHNVVQTYDGASNNALYVDGALTGTSTQGLTTDSSLIGVGQRVNNVSQFTGAIDEVAVWNRGLSASEVATLYNGGVGVAYPFAASPGPASISDASALARAGVATTLALPATMRLANGAQTAWSATGLPAGVALSGRGDLTVGASTAAGSSRVTVTATNYGTAPASATLTLTVDAPPVLTAASLGLTQGVPYSGSLATVMSASALSGATWTSGALPGGMALGTDGTLSGTPTTVIPSGTPLAVQVTVTNSDGLATTATLNASVQSSTTAAQAYPVAATSVGSGAYNTFYPDNTPKAVGAGYDANLASVVAPLIGNGYAGIAYTFAQPVSWDGTVQYVNAGGTTYGNQNGATYLFYNSGTASAPTWTRWTASSGTVTASQFEIIGGNGAITGARLGFGGSYPAYLPGITAARLTPTVGSQVSVGLDAAMATTNASGTETWAVASGSLPDGLTLTGSGTIVGAPTTVGDATVAVTVTDSQGVSSAPTNLTVSVQSSTTAAQAYPVAATSVGSGAYNTFYPDNTPKAVGAGYDANLASVVAPLIGNGYAGVAYTYAQPVSWDGTLQMVAPSGTAYGSGAGNVFAFYNAGTTSSPSWVRWTTASGTVTATQFQVVSSSSAITGLRLGFGGTLPTYLPGITSTRVTPTVGASSNVGLDAAMAATNASGTETWAVASGTLPDGLSLTPGGAIVGTPTTIGDATVAVTVTDARGAPSAPTNLTVSVQAAVTTAQAYPTSATSVGAGAATSQSSYADNTPKLVAAGYDASTTTIVAPLAGGGWGGVAYTFAQPVSWDGTTQATSNSGTTYTTSSALLYAYYNAGTAANPSWTRWVAGTGAVTATQFEVVVQGTALSAARIGYGGAYPAYLPSLSATRVTPPVGAQANVGLDAAMATANASGTETWTQASGTLPDGLSLTASGAIVGTPTAIGDATVQVSVTDASGIASAPTSLTVSVQSGVTAAQAYPAGATSIGGGAYNTNSSFADNTTTLVAAGYDATPGSIVAPIVGSYAGVAYTYAQPVSWDGTAQLTTTAGSTSNSSSVTLITYYNAGTAAAPSWTRWTTATGVITATQFEIVTQSNGLGGARFGFGNAYPAYLPSGTSGATSAPAGKQVSIALDATLGVVNAAAGESWTLASGTLPAGLSLDGTAGTVSGTTSSDATGSVTLVVTDNRGYASAPLTLTFVPSASATYPTAIKNNASGSSVAVNTLYGATNTVTTGLYNTATNGLTYTFPSAVTANGFDSNGTCTSPTITGTVAGAQVTATASAPVSSTTFRVWCPSGLVQIKRGRLGLYGTFPALK